MALDLRKINRGFPGLTAARATSMHEAAAVCLVSNSHAPGANISIHGYLTKTDTLDWTPPNSQVHSAWSDLHEATEHGAYGVAALLVEELTSLTIMERARKKTGFDYWVGPKGTNMPLFQNKRRLEVSGILRGTQSMVTQRLNTKIAQVTGVPSPLQALVVIIEFGAPLGHMRFV